MGLRLSQPWIGSTFELRVGLCDPPYPTLGDAAIGAASQAWGHTIRTCYAAIPRCYVLKPDQWNCYALGLGHYGTNATAPAHSEGQPPRMSVLILKRIAHSAGSNGRFASDADGQSQS